MANEIDDVNKWRTDVQNSIRSVDTKVTSINELLLGTEFKPGLMNDHKLLMKATFGDPETSQPGLVRDMQSVKNFKTLVTHAAATGIGVLLTALIYHVIGSGPR